VVVLVAIIDGLASVPVPPVPVPSVPVVPVSPQAVSALSARAANKLNEISFLFIRNSFRCLCGSVHEGVRLADRVPDKLVYVYKPQVSRSFAWNALSEQHD
jgi:hypothetical protein